MSKYIGFKDHADLYSQFQNYDWKERARHPIHDFPTDDQIRIAIYVDEDYSGDAVVVFERNGKVFEATGSHCSCDGLEGQWEPKETTWGALAMRRPCWADESYEYGYSKNAADAWHAFLAARQEHKP